MNKHLQPIELSHTEVMELALLQVHLARFVAVDMNVGDGSLAIFVAGSDYFYGREPLSGFPKGIIVFIEVLIADFVNRKYESPVVFGTVWEWFH